MADGCYLSILEGKGGTGTVVDEGKKRKINAP